MWNQVVFWPTMVDIMNLRVINLQDRDSLFAKDTRPVPHFITQRYHYIVVCTLGCRAGIYCIDPWAYLDGWNEGQGQGEITFFTFCRGYSDHSERKFRICVGNTWPQGICTYWWIFCFCFMFLLFYIIIFLLLFPALLGVGWELCMHISSLYLPTSFSDMLPSLIPGHSHYNLS